MSSKAIIVDNISKYFEVYTNPQNRLKDMVYPKIQKMLGKPIHQYHQKFWALKDVSFEIEKGETVGILGQNGSGKSTLLQIIMGTMNASKGSVTTNGKVSGLLELGSGFNPEFTGRENVYLNGSLLGLSKSEIDNKFDAIASFADIGEHLDMAVKTYSSGMMLRLAFAVQVFVDSDILIIDEALAVGDARFQLKCFRKLQEIKDRGTTILFVSHALETVKTFCNSGIVLDYGVLKYQGNAATAAIQYSNILFPKVQETLETDINEKIEGQINRQHTVAIKDNRIFINNIVHESSNVFGAGGGWLESLEIKGTEGKNFQGGEEIEVDAYFKWDPGFIKPILEMKGMNPNIALGFALADKMGNYVFGTNAFDKEVDINIFSSSFGKASIQFKMPYLSAGSYFVTITIAVGSLPNHEQLRWYDHIFELVCFAPKRNVYGYFALDYEYSFTKEENNHEVKVS